MAENSTEAKTSAASFLGKILRWIVLFMSDLGLPFQGPIPICLPFQGPIPIADDNAATQIIAHSKKTRNIQRIAIKTLTLQGRVQSKIAVFNLIGMANT
jgi:hypothetical protein